MNVSVIVPTYNGATKIVQLLKCLAEQVHTPYEIIVVVDGSTDNTTEVLQSNNSFGSKLKVIVQENSGRAKVRNRGAREASGSLLIFLDDDMLPTPACISEHVRHHQESPGSILTGGISEVEGDKDFQQFRSWLSRRWLKPFRLNEHAAMEKDRLFLAAANFSINRQLFFDLEGFDTQLKDAEDFDLGLRAFDAGVPLYYRHAAFAWHNDQVSGKAYINRLREYRLAHLQLAHNNAKLHKVETGADVPSIAKWKKSLLALFSHDFWVLWLDTNFLKKILPRRVRYKLYDLIVTSNGVYFPDKVRL